MNRGGELLFNFSLAAGKMGEEGIMVDILLRLPVKSLSRFKCVCKSWRDLISDPCFARAHFSRYMLGNPNSQRLLLAIRQPDSDLKFLCSENTNSDEAIEVENDLLECPVKFKLPNPSILCTNYGSCHGLVCLHLLDETFNSRTLVVWNPTTGAFKEIPPLHPGVTHDFFVAGIGYDSASDDYKVLAYVHGREELVIFAMKENYWRSVCIGLVQKTAIGPGIYANGFLHWFQLNNDDSCSILSFDLSNEKFEMIPPPAGLDFAYLLELKELKLMEFQGSLLLYTAEDDYRCQKCWIMEGNGSWTKVCDITCQSGDGETTDRVMCCKTDGKVLLRFPHEESLCLYSPKKKQFTPFAPFKNPMLRYAQLYVESLVSP